MDFILWIVLTVLLIVIEIATEGLVSVWFAAGSFVALIVSFFTDSFIITGAVFVAVSVLALFLTRPLVRKLKRKTDAKTNFDRILGMTGVVTERIENLASTGYVSVDGKEWMARTDDNDTTIDVGTRVTVLRIEGAKIFVETNK